MHKTWLILSHEALTILRSRSFLLALILVPLVSFIILLIAGALQRRNPSPDPITLLTPEKPPIKGVVDLSGLIWEIPPAMEGQVRSYPSPEAGLRALQDGEITMLYVVAPDYLTSGKIDLYAQEINLFQDARTAYPVDWLISYNLFKDRPALFDRITVPMNLSVEQVASERPPRATNETVAFFVPYGIAMFFYLFILGTSSVLLSSINTEKQNRVIEILLSSATPSQMMAGKIIGLGLVGLLQMTVWLGVGLWLLQFSSGTFAALQGIQLPPNLLGWGILYFILGYTIFAALMGGIGALAPNLREASQVTFLVILPLIIPLMFLQLLINRPDSALSLALSLFPFTSPVAMMTRLAAVPVPAWQLALGAALQALAAFLVIRVAAGMFRAQNLLSGQPFNLGLFFRALIGKA